MDILVYEIELLLKIGFYWFCGQWVV